MVAKTPSMMVILVTRTWITVTEATSQVATKDTINTEDISKSKDVSNNGHTSNSITPNNNKGSGFADKGSSNNNYSSNDAEVTSNKFNSSYNNMSKIIPRTVATLRIAVTVGTPSSRQKNRDNNSNSSDGNNRSSTSRDRKNHERQRKETPKRGLYREQSRQ